MALVLKDRVKETSTTAGTGTLTLDGAASGFQSFAAVGNGNTTYYAIVDPITGDWEVGLGTYTSSGTTLSRTTVLSSSNSGSLVNFAANQKDVFVTYPSEKSVYEDASNVVNATSFGAITATSAALTTGTVSTTPTSSTDIANKQYVDTVSASGIHYHTPVYVEVPDTFGNLNATYNNGASGVGATLTNAGTQAAFTADGISVPLNSRVLVYNQTNAAQNGVYTLTTVGSPSTNWVLTRATDADTYSPYSPTALGQGDAFFVTNGLTGAGETYICNTVGTITFGTTAITFAQISDSTLYTAGTGLTLTGTEFSITPTGTAGTYGSASSVPVLTTNASGQVTGVTNTNIAISGSAVSGNITGSAGSVANALTLGSYLTGTSFNGSSAVTATVDATSANTASKVVARDASGNFSAGTITATLSGAATSATTATNIAGGAANQIPYQTGSGTTSFITAPTTGSTFLSWNGSAFVYSAISTPASVTFNSSGLGDASGTTFNGSTARTISYNTVGAPSTGGTGATGTWGISISGNAATATSATSATSAANLTGGSISGNYTINNATSPNTYYLQFGDNTGWTYRFMTNVSGTPTVRYSFTDTGNFTAVGSVTASSFSGAGTGLTGTAASLSIGGNAATATTAANVNNGTLTMAVSGTGLSGSASFTANQAGASTFTVTSNATNANTASTIVARDASGNFSAGTITAALSGNATTATTAGTITGQANSATITATSANTANQIVLRDASGNFSAGTITATLSGNASTATSATSATTATNQSGGTVNATTGAFSGQVTQSGNSATIYGPNSTWGAYLQVGGNGRTVSGTLYASVAATDGNLHIDCGSNKGLYLNYYSGTDGIKFGNGASGIVGSMTAGGALTMTSFSGAGTGLTGTAASLSIGGNAATATSATSATSATTATTATTANALNTANNYQVNSLGVGTAGSGTAGEIRATNNVTAYYSSDIKFKENVRDIPNAAATAAAIGGKLFDWKAEYIEEHGGEDGYFIVKSDFGVIAQDVLAKFPVAVRTRPDGSLAVDYEKLSALALAANAEHEERIAKLEALVAKLIEG